MTRPTGRSQAAALLAVVWVVLLSSPARGYEAFDGDVQVHGFYRAGFGAIGDGFERKSDWYVAQFSHTLNLEFEWDIAQDGWGPFSEIGAYARVEVRFDCVWSRGCHLFDSVKIFGNDPSHAPSKNLTDARLTRRSGFVDLSETRVQGTFPARRAFLGTTRLRNFVDVPPLDDLAELGATGLDATFSRITHQPLVALKKIDGSFTDVALPLGPMNTDSHINSLGPLRHAFNRTSHLPLRPMVPLPGKGRQDFRKPQGLWVPTAALRDRIPNFDRQVFTQNLREHDLRVNHGSSQDEKELKEAYLDLEMLDGALFLRVGKQQIVWGKTELFRNQDQFNPQDLALSSLPSLEESRVALWAVRGIYSLYNVGPFEDVRVELAAILDDYEPADFGRCGEPYTVFLVCGLSFGTFAHGIAGFGIAGVDKPPDPWDSWKGLEVGGRLEFRYGRFSFAVTDYYGYSDFPTANMFYEFERRVDGQSGRPLDVYGQEMDPADVRSNLLNHTANRQLYDLVCGITAGIADALLPSLAGECLTGLLNNQVPLPLPIALPGLRGVAAADALAAALAGYPVGEVVLQALVDPANVLVLPPPVALIPLNVDLNDGPGPPPGLLCNNFVFGTSSCLSEVLTDQQEALLGCGPFYGTNCDVDGIDLFNAEASVLFQSFVTFEPGGPVATRYENGSLFVLPGARGPDDAGYNPGIDGCVGPSHSDCAGATQLVDPLTGERFENELGALSFNFMRLLAAIGQANEGDEFCSVDDPLSCVFVRGVFAIAGIQHYDVRAGGNGTFGRRTFIWHGGGPVQLQFNKRNIFGFAMDFAEDITKTNWGIEFSWVENEALPVRTRRNGFRKADVYNLTVSVDRPTFVNFLNQGRTIFFNSQWFFQYIPEYSGQDVFNGNGPLTVLGTFSAFTAYFQDRLIVASTFVHDFSSSSGGFIFSTTYRFTEALSASVGVNIFYGGPEQQEQSLHPLAIGNNGGSFKSRSKFQGLSILSERDEITASLRYTF